MNTKPIVEQPKSRCSKCQSTERTGYTHTETKRITGMHNGQPYNRVVWRSCKCTHCGQHRQDKSYEMVPESPARGESKNKKGEVRGNSPAAKTESAKQNSAPQEKTPTKKPRSGKSIG
jgi:hypothetical protein